MPTDINMPSPDRPFLLQVPEQESKPSSFAEFFAQNPDYLRPERIKKRGESIYTQGLPAGVHFLQNGVVLLSRREEDGEQTIYDIVRSGAVFGLETVENDDISLHAQAYKPSVVRSVDMRKIDCLSEEPIFKDLLLKQLNETLKRIIEWSCNKTRPSHQRLASALLEFVLPEEREFVGTQEILGWRTSMIRETINKLLQQFERAELIAKSRGAIGLTIINREALQVISTGEKRHY